MPHPRHVALHAGIYIAATLSGIAVAYVLNEWALHWWDVQRPPHISPDGPNNEPKTSCSRHDTSPTMEGVPTQEVPAPAPEHADPNRDAHTPLTSQTRALPPLCTHSLPPPLPNGRALLSSSSLGTNPDAMTSSASLHTLSSQDSVDEEGTLQSNTSDTMSEPFVDVLSPSPVQVISRRRSFRNHDLFAASHISFSELGSLVAPQDEPH